jgi:filamentous hemagglutinin
MSNNTYNASNGANGLAPLWFAARASAFAALCAFGMQPLAASAQPTLPISPAGGSPSGPTVGTSASGAQIVNIVAPNARGVSNNRFDQYNVGTAGVVINNSAQNSQTQLAGTVQGNAQLGKQGANLVLLQVTSGAPSQLLGKTEIAGQGANLVLANPAGITCSGCGFLNAPRVTLATGTPTLNADGSLAGFDVRQGQIAVNGAGLSASNSAVDLIARAMTINGQVQARSIDAIAGANRVDYATNNVTAQQGSGDKPAVAIDVQALGSMYGNGAVRLIGTESGVGVRESGKVSSLTGNITVSTNGDVTIAAPGSMQAGGDMSVKGANVTNLGTLAAARGLDLRADQALVNAGNVSADSLAAAGVQSLTNSGSLSATGDASVGGMRLTLDNGKVSAARQVSLSGQTVSNQHGTVAAGDTLAVYADRLDNSQGKMSAGGDASIHANNVLTNANGVLSAAGNMQIDGSTLDNTNGRLGTNHGDLMVRASGSLLNTNGSMQSGNTLAVDAGNVINTNGTMTSAANAMLNVSGNLQNVAGVIASGNGLQVNSAALDNTDGTLRTSAGMLSANAPVALDNTRGHIVSGGDLSLAATDLNTTDGDISAALNARLLAMGTVQNVGGKISAGNLLDITAAALDNRNGGTIAAQQPQGMLVVNASGTVDNSGGSMSSGGLVNVSANTLNNDAGAITAADMAGVNVNAALSNRGGSITAGNTVFGSAGSLDNTGGTISAPAGANIVVANNPNPSDSGSVVPPAPPVQPVQPVQPVPQDASSGIAYDLNPGWVDPNANSGWVDPNAMLHSSVDYSNREAQTATLMNNGVPASQQFGFNASSVFWGA